MIVVIVAVYNIIAKTVDCFPHLEICMLASGIMKSSPQGGGYHVRSSLGPLNHVSKVHGIFSSIMIYFWS